MAQAAAMSANDPLSFDLLRGEMIGLPTLPPNWFSYLSM
jgi:hypothetical protein